MLLILLTSLIYLIILKGYGYLASKLLNPQKLISLDLLNGFLIIGIISSISAIFVPLNQNFEILIISLGLLLAIYSKFWKDQGKINYKSTSFLFLTLIICFVSSMNAYIFDTFSYYFPTIKWLDDYGFVKGLANFDFFLGQTSLWHIIQASFNESLDPYYKINAVLALVFLIYIYESYKTQFIFFFALFFLFLASPSPDLPVFIISAIVILNYLHFKDNSAIRFGFIMATFLVVIKPITFILAMFFVYQLFKAKHKINLKILVIFCLLVLIFIVKNIILTANLTFPLAFGNLTSSVYSVPQHIYELSGVDGRYLATSRVNPVDYEAFKSWGYLQYYRYIFSNLHLSIYIYLGLTFINFIFLIYTISLKSRDLIVLACLILFKSFVFWIISIQYRFILDGTLIILCILLVNVKSRKKVQLPLILFTSLILVFAAELRLTKKVYFMYGIAMYKVENLLTPKNYIVKTKRSTYSNFEANYITNSIITSDAKQPAVGERMLEMNAYKNNLPKLLDSTNIKSGFISVVNKNTNTGY